ERTAEVGVDSTHPLATRAGRVQALDQFVAERTVAEHEPRAGRDRTGALQRLPLPRQREQRVFDRMPRAADRTETDAAHLEPGSGAFVVRGELPLELVADPT